MKCYKLAAYSRCHCTMAGVGVRVVFGLFKKPKNRSILGGPGPITLYMHRVSKGMRWDGNGVQRPVLSFVGLESSLVDTPPLLSSRAAA